MASTQFSFSDTSPHSRKDLHHLRIVVWLISLCAGLLQAWAYRFYIEPDGVNYLDIAGAYLRRDWANALNAYWSPLYSWLLGLIHWTFRPSPYLESTTLHLLNFVLFLAALASFEFFFRRFLSLLTCSSSPEKETSGVREWAWWTFGYTVFLVATLRLIDLRNDTPDMALAVILFLATGFLADLAQSDRGTLRYAFLGLILGVGYLAKGVMLPLSLVYVVTAAFAHGGLKKPNLRAIATLAGFLLVSAPFAISLSRVKGRLTFGDTGKVAYFNQVTGVPLSATDNRRFTHHPVRLFDEPPVYLYTTPFASTYPAWYDPSYWLEGVTPNLVLRDQLGAIGRNLSACFRIISTEKQWICGYLVLLLLAREWRQTWRLLLKLLPIWLPPTVALALYSLVLVEPRYVAVPLALVCLTLFAAVPWSRINAGRSVGAAVLLAVSATGTLAIGKDALTNLGLCMHPEKHVQWEVAQGLLKMGFAPGDHVAVLGHTTVADYWAHLAGFRIVADIPLEAIQSYWLASPDTREQISSQLRAQGIRALITSDTPLGPANWRRIPTTPYYMQMLAPTVQPDKMEN